jgi:stearoyl-CoA desaturase (delta-9 desaturase)
MADHSHLNWITVGALVLIHAGAVAALFLFTWPALWTALPLLWISGGWGIGMGYHRLLTHRGYETRRWLECLLAVCGTLALQGGPLFWVATHRLHHQNADENGDPHSPRDGWWWCHAGWLVWATRCAMRPSRPTYRIFGATHSIVGWRNGTSFRWSCLR